jgi:hypothetical protein
MLGRVLWVICSFLLACFAAGLTITLFAFPPTPTTISDAFTGDAVVDLCLFALAVAQFCAVFAAPFALLGVMFAERHGIRSWTSNVLAGIVIAGFGVLTRYASEAADGPSIVNAYALSAFLAAGIVLGTTYWVLAGRFATKSTVARSVPASPGQQAAQESAPQTSASTFTIDRASGIHDKCRLLAPTKLTRADFFAVADRIGRRPIKARKIGLVAARNAQAVEPIETRWNGKETTNTAQPGDWIVTSLSRDGEVMRDASGNENTYVIKAETFTNLYESAVGENEFGRFFRAKNTVDALFLSGGFEILAPWGQSQTADSGYLLFNGEEVYGNNKTTFEETYEFVA